MIERFNWELCDDAEGLSPIRVLEIDIAFPPTILDPTETDYMNLLADHIADDPTADINYFAGAAADDDLDGDFDLEAELAKVMEEDASEFDVHDDDDDDDDVRVDQEEQRAAARADDRVCPVSGDIPTMAHTLDYRRA